MTMNATDTMPNAPNAPDATEPQVVAELYADWTEIRRLAGANAVMMVEFEALQAGFDRGRSYGLLLSGRCCRAEARSGYVFDGAAWYEPERAPLPAAQELPQ